MASSISIVIIFIWEFLLEKGRKFDRKWETGLKGANFCCPDLSFATSLKMLEEIFLKTIQTPLNMYTAHVQL